MASSGSLAAGLKQNPFRHEFVVFSPAQRGPYGLRDRELRPTQDLSIFEACWFRGALTAWLEGSGVNRSTKQRQVEPFAFGARLEFPLVHSLSGFFFCSFEHTEKQTTRKPIIFGSRTTVLANPDLCQISPKLVGTFEDSTATRKVCDVNRLAPWTPKLPS